MSKTPSDAMLRAGSRVDEYEILGPIGHGDMGEVYKARDTRVDRIVAVKVLPRGFAGDEDAEDRFEREARALAALSHPRICSLFEFTRYDGTTLLVMEYVEGQTLAERLVNGRIPLNDAVHVAIEIADGLAAAHRAGLIHRDLKPANIMLTKSGAKLLDFGVAKLTRPAIASDEPTNTAHDHVTQVGVAIGTPSYMAPEQLSGRAADVRTDIWALGCVLYQMITGALPFQRATFADQGASLFEENPPTVATNGQPGTAALDRVIRKCLAKDPDARWQSAADLRDALTWIASDIANSRTLRHARVHRRWFWASAVVVAVAVSAIVGLFYGASTSRPSDSPVRQLELTVPRLAALESLALSRDGANLAFIGPGSDGIPVVWVRPMGGPTARVLPGTEGADPQCPPFWSPDGQSLAFVGGSKLRRIDINGGQAQPIADVSGAIFGGDWGRDLAYESSQTGQMQVYVTAVPPTGQQWQVSSRGGQQPEWRRDGRELFYLAPDGTIMSTLVDTTTHFDFSAARPLFRTELRGQGAGRRYAVTADGRRFLLSVPREGDKTATTTTFRVLLNWTHASAR